MKLQAGLLSLLLLAGCVSTPPPRDDAARYGPQPSQEQAVAAVTSYVQRVGFKDPDSVLVRDIRVGQATRYFRGLINGGGYYYGWEIYFEANA